MAAWQAQESQVLTASTTDSFATFEGGLQRIHISVDADSYVDFDRTASSTGSIYVPAKTSLDLDFGFASVKEVHAVAATGTSHIYILGIRGNRS